MLFNNIVCFPRFFYKDRCFSMLKNMFFKEITMCFTEFSWTAMNILLNRCKFCMKNHKVLTNTVYLFMTLYIFSWISYDIACCCFHKFQDFYVLFHDISYLFVSWSGCVHAFPYFCFTKIICFLDCSMESQYMNIL